MAKYEWSEAMSVGVPILDSDHKALIHLINTLHNELELDEDSAKLDQVIEHLAIYVELHFAREESVMEACGYPATEAHREEHRQLAHDVQGFRERHSIGGGSQLRKELFDFLKDWLNHHILMQDMHYKKYAEGNPQALEAAQRFGPGLSDRNRKDPGSR